MAYSLAEAVKATGKSRQALQSAIKKGTISASKNAFGRWELDPSELHRVYPPTKQLHADAGSDLQLSALEKDAEIKVLEARLKALMELKEYLERENADLRQDRDLWRDQAKALPAPDPEPEPEKEEAPKKGFLRRLFG